MKITYYYYTKQNGGVNINCATAQSVEEFINYCQKEYPNKILYYSDPVYDENICCDCSDHETGEIYFTLWN